MKPDLHDLVAAARKRVSEITPEQAATGLKSGKTKFLDVREMSEWAGGRIASAAHVPVWQVEEDAYTSLSELKDDPIVVYCSHGVRSLLAADSLKRLGFTNVSSISGGLVAWQDQGLPIERDS